MQARPGFATRVGMRAGTLGLGADRGSAREQVKHGMETFYRLAFERFERYTPYGTPDEVADALLPFVHAGARTLNLTICVANSAEAIDLGGQVKRLLMERLA